MPYYGDGGHEANVISESVNYLPICRECYNTFIRKVCKREGVINEIAEQGHKTLKNGDVLYVEELSQALAYAVCLGRITSYHMIVNNIYKQVKLKIDYPHPENAINPVPEDLYLRLSGLNFVNETGEFIPIIKSEKKDKLDDGVLLLIGTLMELNFYHLNLPFPKTPSLDEQVGIMMTFLKKGWNCTGTKTVCPLVGNGQNFATDIDNFKTKSQMVAYVNEKKRFFVNDSFIASVALEILKEYQISVLDAYTLAKAKAGYLNPEHLKRNITDVGWALKESKGNAVLYEKFLREYPNNLDPVGEPVDWTLPTFYFDGSEKIVAETTGEMVKGEYVDSKLENRLYKRDPVVLLKAPLSDYMDIYAKTKNQNEISDRIQLVAN